MKKLLERTSLVSMAIAFSSLAMGCDSDALPVCVDDPDVDQIPDIDCRCGLGYTDFTHVCCSALANNTTVDCGPGPGPEVIEVGELMDAEGPKPSGYLYYRENSSGDLDPVLGVFSMQYEVGGEVEAPDGDESFEITWLYGNPMNATLYPPGHYNLYQAGGLLPQLRVRYYDTGAVAESRNADWPRINSGEVEGIAKDLILAAGLYEASVENLPADWLGDNALSRVPVGEY